MKKILFATSEAVPFIKTGGLADVAGSLPKCFDKKYFDILHLHNAYIAVLKSQIHIKMGHILHFVFPFLFHAGIFRLEYKKRSFQ